MGSVGGKNSARSLLLGLAPSGVAAPSLATLYPRSGEALGRARRDGSREPGVRRPQGGPSPGVVAFDRYGRAVPSGPLLHHGLDPPDSDAIIDATGHLANDKVKDLRTLDGRTEKIFEDNRMEVEFTNGLKKMMWPDGRTSVLFQNGDDKEIHPDGVVVYHYKATGATQTTTPDGTELYEFKDGQSERHSPDGAKEIRFPNGTIKSILADGSEEVVFADGTVRRRPQPS